MPCILGKQDNSPMKIQDNSQLLVYLQEQHQSGKGTEVFRDAGPVLADLAVAAISGDIAETSRQFDALRDLCSCFEALKQV